MARLCDVPKRKMAGFHPCFWSSVDFFGSITEPLFFKSQPFLIGNVEKSAFLLISVSFHVAIVVFRAGGAKVALAARQSRSCAHSDARQLLRRLRATTHDDVATNLEEKCVSHNSRTVNQKAEPKNHQPETNLTIVRGGNRNQQKSQKRNPAFLRTTMPIAQIWDDGVVKK